MSVFAAHQTEADFTTTVIDFARLHGWLAHHDRPARIRSKDRAGNDTESWRTAIQGDRGFPDLLLVGHGRIVAAELKVKGRATTPGQDDWLWQLGKADVEVHVWTPDDWPAIEACLGRRRRTA